MGGRPGASRKPARKRRLGDEKGDAGASSESGRFCPPPPEEEAKQPAAPPAPAAAAGAPG